MYLSIHLSAYLSLASLSRGAADPQGWAGCGGVACSAARLGFV